MEDVGINHRRFHILVPQQLLHGADVVAVFEQVGSEGVAEGMGGDVFVDVGQTVPQPSARSFW